MICGSSCPLNADLQPVASAKLPKGGSSVSASKSVKVKSEPASRSKKSAPVENSTKSSKDSKEAKPVIKREKKVYELPGQTRDPPDEVSSQMPYLPVHISVQALGTGRQKAPRPLHMSKAFLSISGLPERPIGFDRLHQARLNPDQGNRVWLAVGKGCHLLQLDPLRKFYSSLKQQRPESQMARKWCVLSSAPCSELRSKPLVLPPNTSKPLSSFKLQNGHDALFLLHRSPLTVLA